MGRVAVVLFVLALVAGAPHAAAAQFLAPDRDSVTAPSEATGSLGCPGKPRDMLFAVMPNAVIASAEAAKDWPNLQKVAASP